jgi:putative ABC transport system permease protein
VSLFRRIEALASRSKVEQEIADELNSHIEMRTADNMAQGMSPEESRRDAVLQFGNPVVIKERVTATDAALAFENIWWEIRYTLRQLRKSPGFTIAAVLMLTLGIGATTAIFSIVEGVLLRPLPFPEPDRVVLLSDNLNRTNSASSGVTGPDIVAFTRDTHSFASLGGYKQDGYELSGSGDPEHIRAARLGAGVLPALGVAPLLGRVFTRQEDDERQQVMVLSYALWQRRFAGDPHVLGDKLLLDRKPYTVIGVMPRDFEFPLMPGHLNRSELWVPLSLAPSEVSADAQGSWNYRMVGRLKPGIETVQAQEDAERIAEQITRDRPAFLSSLRISSVVHPLKDDTIAEAAPLIRTLFLAVAVVLLIACANFAGLLLVRAIHRRPEIAVRLALGASAATLLRETILESLLLSIAGGVAGLGLADLALRAGLSALPETMPRIDDIRLDWKVVAFALFVAILTGVFCGLAPAFTALRTDVNDALKEGGRTGIAGGGHAHLRSALVIAEIAIALVLLSAAGLLLRSFERMREVDLGFRPDHTVAANYDLPEEQYATQSSVDTFNKELLLRLQQLPSVRAAGLTSQLPASGDHSRSTFLADGYIAPKGSAFNLAWTSDVMGNYFQAIGIPLLRGRLFTEADNAQSQLVVIINRKIAEHYWPGQDPIGKRIRMGVEEMATPWMTVVGEVADVKQSTPDQDASEQIYLAAGQTRLSFGPLFSSQAVLFDNESYIVMRSALPPEQMENSLRATVRSLDPQLPLSQLQTMEHAVSGAEASRRFNTALISAFAAAAVLLAIFGIYSVIAFSVDQRTQEMAIRVALGAQRSSIRSLVLLSGAKLALVGCAIGVAGALAASRLLRSFLFGVSSYDPVVLTLAAVIALLLALAAALGPARRAASTEPMQALRAE